MSESSGPLDGVRVLDLSRILAGPSCAQVLGDLGADVIKVERPGRGDDTRGWGPPFVAHAATGEGGELGDAAYFLAANRNKRSIAIDLATDEGAAIVRALAARSDVLIENFKVGDLARRGLGPAQLLGAHPGLVYCSITGFGQTGPRAREPGYDALAQAMGGIMSLTGPEDGAPHKVGVGVSDLFCGMYAAVAILAALRHRDRTGEGQHLDVALFDAQLAWLANAAQDYFATGRPPARHGNAHPHIVPYDVFAASDGHVVIAVGNDAQWRRFCEATGEGALGRDPRYATNADRVRRRHEVSAEVARVTGARTVRALVALLGAVGVPCGPVNDVQQAFEDPQAIARGARVRIDDAARRGGAVDVVASPIRASRTPVTYRRPPPRLGAHGDEVLREVLGASEDELVRLRGRGALGGEPR